MRRWIFGLLLCIANPLVGRAEPFERAQVTKAINIKTVGDLGRNKYFRAAAAMVDLAERAK